MGSDSYSVVSDDYAALLEWGYQPWVGEHRRSYQHKLSETPGSSRYEHSRFAHARCELGRVVRVDRGECDVVTSKGLLRVQSDSATAQSETAPVTGDWVEVVSSASVSNVSVPQRHASQLSTSQQFAYRSHISQPHVSAPCVIAAVIPRRTTLTRRDPAKRENMQTLAANIDVVGIVVALDQPMPPGRFERLLVMAIDSSASILVVLTKMDRAKNKMGVETTVRAIAEGIPAIADGIPVVVTSAVTGVGFDAVRSRLGMGITMALVGASGSGKSSLVNTLADCDVLPTGNVRAKDSRGRHTTVARELVKLPGDAGLMLDTPGVRFLGLWDCENALTQVFADIEDRAVNCRFRDCKHNLEPDCAVKRAVEVGDISATRLARYQSLLLDIQNQQTRVASSPHRR